VECALHHAAPRRLLHSHPSGPISTIKQHLPAIRVLWDWLVVSQIQPANPADAVRGPKDVVTKGSTPLLSVNETRASLDAIEIDCLVDLRARVLTGRDGL